MNDVPEHLDQDTYDALRVVFRKLLKPRGWVSPDGAIRIMYWHGDIYCNGKLVMPIGDFGRSVWEGEHARHAVSG